jgi:hypothetical protein
MTQRNAMIGQVFERLAAAPAELDPTVSEVLIACGQFVGTILKEGYQDADRQNVMNWFCQGLRSYVNRTRATAELKQLN